ncbi:MAG: hypothetical protein ACE5NG_14825 [bacterium]
MKVLKIPLFFVAICLSSGLLYCGKDRNPVETQMPMVPGKYLAYVQNHAQAMWIGTNSDSMGALMRRLVGTDQGSWIGGRVVPHMDYPYHFYFDPNTVLIAELTAEGMQTTIQQIARAPEYFASHGWSNGLAQHAWYVWGHFLEYRNNE